MPSEPENNVYLHPGHIYFTQTPTIVTTILGSCVSVCLFAEARGAAGMNHYVLPVTSGLDSPRFAPVANEMLLQRFAAEGIARTELRAKIFGGASIGIIRNSLASRNIAAADDFLSGLGIPVEARDVGGSRGRKLLFRTSDGAAWVRLL